MPSLADEQTLAFAMARHPRLGASSGAAALLNDDMIQHIHRFVSQAHVELLERKRLLSVCVRTGDLVDRLEVCCDEA